MKVKKIKFKVEIRKRTECDFSSESMQPVLHFLLITLVLEKKKVFCDKDLK